MIDYVLHALPTAVLVLIYFVRTESRLTRIETNITWLIKNPGCKTEGHDET